MGNKTESHLRNRHRDPGFQRPAEEAPLEKEVPEKLEDTHRKRARD